MKFEYLGKTLNAVLVKEKVDYGRSILSYLKIDREDDCEIQFRQILNPYYAYLPRRKVSDALALLAITCRNNKTLKRIACYLSGNEKASGAKFRRAIYSATDEVLCEWGKEKEAKADA